LRAFVFLPFDILERLVHPHALGDEKALEAVKQTLLQSLVEIFSVKIIYDLTIINRKSHHLPILIEFVSILHSDLFGEGAGDKILVFHVLFPLGELAVKYVQVFLLLLDQRHAQLYFFALRDEPSARLFYLEAQFTGLFVAL